MIPIARRAARAGTPTSITQWGYPYRVRFTYTRIMSFLCNATTIWCNATYRAQRLVALLLALAGPAAIRRCYCLGLAASMAARPTALPSYRVGVASERIW